MRRVWSRKPQERGGHDPRWVAEPQKKELSRGLSFHSTVTNSLDTFCFHSLDLAPVTDSEMHIITKRLKSLSPSNLMVFLVSLQMVVSIFVFLWRSTSASLRRCFFLFESKQQLRSCRKERMPPLVNAAQFRFLINFPNFPNLWVIIMFPLAVRSNSCFYDIWIYDPFS